MPEVINVPRLAEHGFVPDATASTLPPNAFTYARNWRFNTAGFAEVSRGYADVFSSTALTGRNLGNANTIVTFVSSYTLGTSPAVFFYDETSRRMNVLELSDDGSMVNELVVSPNQHVEDIEHEWQATNAFGIPIFNNGVEAPWEHFLDNGADSIRELSNWPGSGATCEFLTFYGNQLIAVGYQNPSAGAGLRGGRRVLAISDGLTTPGTLPDWDFARATNTNSLAQLFDLSLHTDGELVSAYEQDGVLFVNTTTNVIALQNLGAGEFSATTLPFPHGTLTKRTTAQVPNGQFNIGNRKMYIHDGTNAQLVGEGLFVEAWFNALDASRLNEVQSVYDPRTSSVWIKTPTSSSTQEMWIYNLENNTLAVLDDHQEIEFMFFSAEGIPTLPVTWDTLNEDLTWDGLTTDTWNDFPTLAGGAQFRNRLLSCGARNIFVHDEGTSFHGRDFIATLRKQDTPVGGDTYASAQIQRVVPWVSSPNAGASLTIRVGTSGSPNAPVSYTASRTLQVDTGEKLDFRKTGKWAAIEFTSMTSGLRLSGYELEINTTQKGR